MIKNSLKNFFRNFVYMFVAMGIVYLFLLIAVFVFVADVLDNAGGTLHSLFALIDDSAQQSSASVNEFLSYAFGQIDWDRNLWDVIREIIDEKWLQNTVKGFFNTLSVSTEGFEENFNAIIDSFKGKLIGDVAVCAVLCVTGVVAANFATRFAIRRRSARRNLRKTFIAYTIVPIVQSLAVVSFLLLYAFIKMYSLLISLAILLFAGALSIISAWLVHGSGKIKLKQVLTFGNLIKNIAVTAIILCMVIAVAVGLAFANKILAVLITVPLVIYSLNIISLNTESYVCALAEESGGAQKPSAEQAA